MQVQVTLNASEFLYAAMVGVTRQIDNLRNRRQDRYGAETGRGPWDLHIEGACGELAVAKYYGLYWSGNLGNLHAPDVAGMQVRTTPSRGGDLRLHPNDPDEQWFVLVTGRAPHLCLAGRLQAQDGKLQEYWRDPTHEERWAFFVPQAKLKPMWLPRQQAAAVNGVASILRPL